MEIKLRKINETFLGVESGDDPACTKLLYEHFSFFAPNYMFDPLYNSGRWDGKIRLFNRRFKRIYLGLLWDVIEFLESNGYTYAPDDSLRFYLLSNPRTKKTTVLDENTKNILREIPCSKTPRIHQKAHIAYGVKHKRALLISPTGSGKSLIIYYLCRYFTRSCPDKKVLIVVPTLSLTNQMREDFLDYSFNETTSHVIHEGCPHDNDNENIFISTWQSIFRNPAEWFDQFGMLIADEVHTWDSKSLKTLMEKTTKTEYRLGTSGTLEDSKSHLFTLRGLFGDVYTHSTTSDLIRNKLLSPLTINIMVLNYGEKDRASVPRNYQKEIEFIFSHEQRNRYIVTLISRLKGNTLVLYSRKEAHGKILYDLSKEIFDDSKLSYYVDGDSDVETRERVRKLVDQDTSHNSVIFGSTIFVTGVNIVNLHNLVFASPSKSKIRILQSIGRGLRKTEDDLPTTVYDVVDSFFDGTRRPNHTLRHALHRMKLYDREKFPYKIYNVPLQE